MRKLFAVLLILATSASLFAADWTASIAKKDREGFQLRLIVEYSNGTDKIVKEYRFDGENIDASLQQQVKAQLAKLAAIDSAVASLPTGTIAIIPDKLPDPPTQDDLDLQAFSALVDHYRSVQAELKAGIDKVTQADLDAIAEQIKASFKDSYAKLLVGLF